VGLVHGIDGHASISTAYRNPTWEEIRAARYDHIPDDVTVGMILPPRSEYVNLHEFCFHLHQIPRRGTKNPRHPNVKDESRGNLLLHIASPDFTSPPLVNFSLHGVSSRHATG
jgi:hypothetical protein